MKPAILDVGTVPRKALRTKKSFIAPDEFLTTKEFMQLFKIKHKQTVYTLIAEGLPSLVVGRNYRFIKSEVIAFLKEHRLGRTKGKRSRQ